MTRIGANDTNGFLIRVIRNIRLIRVRNCIE